MYDDLKIGTLVEVSAGGRKLTSAPVTRTKQLINGCVLVAAFAAVPAAASYTFRFGNYQPHEVPYATVAKNWNVVLTP